jgi:hypothetical protein
VKDDAQRDVAPDPETQGEYDPLAYHHSTGREPRRSGPTWA